MDLLNEIDAYLSRAQKIGAPIAETTFGLRAVNDGKFVGRLRDGKDVTMRIAERVRQWIKDNPPRKAP